MIPLKYIRENKDIILKTLEAKKVDFNLNKLLEDDKKWRLLLKDVEDLKSIRNTVSKEIAQLKSKGLKCDDKIKYMRKVSEQIKQSDKEIDSLKETIEESLLYIPNIIHSSAPIGKTEEDNLLVREYGAKPSFNFKIKDHLQIAERLKLLDMARGSKIAGSGFPLYVGKGARLERALISFMLDQHTNNGYIELFPPFLATQNTTQVTGQLPKFEDDMYYVNKDNLYCISTAEVPVTSYYKNEVLSIEDLPSKFAAYSACFRREAGSYGKDTKGLLRVHQFNKVELVKFVSPEKSYEELELLVNDAEKILQLLGLHYRIIELNTSDLSFSAAKCYDIEVWSPAEQKYLEVSSCSNFESFQARRGNMKFRNKEQKLEYLHTLNGSGLATPRLMVAILETFQEEDGSFKVPEVLHKYLNETEINV
tara:strand:+ start:39 stop:1304 length:1266 start_codon:yes stop_codon:yes gene_type:complete